MTEEQRERLKQIQERWAIRTSNTKSWGERPTLQSIGGMSGAMTDISFLLSLIDSQQQRQPTGWISCGLRSGHDRIVDIVFENAECAKAFIDGIEPAVGPVIAATRMHDLCVATLRQIAADYDNAAQPNNGAAISKQAVLYAARQIESLTLDQVEQGKL